MPNAVPNAAGLADPVAGRRRGRLHRAVNDLAGLPDATAKIAELMCVLLERAQSVSPLEHPLWQAADEMMPSLGVILRDIELRRRFRAALDRFEQSANADIQ